MGDGIIHRALHTYRAGGVCGIWQKVQNRLSMKPVYRRLLVLDLPFTDDFSAVEPEVPVTFRELKPSDFGELIALRPYLTEEVIRLRLSAGHRVYVATLGGRIVSTLLVAIDKAYIGYLKIAFPLSQREVYFGEAYTIPEYRGKRIHPACMLFASRQMYQLGYQHGVAFVFPRNRPALCSHGRIGFQKKGFIGFVEGFGISRYVYIASGGFDCLSNALLVSREKLVPPDLQGQIY
jgi:GNAT superfamily N-acetyltransferase